IGDHGCEYMTGGFAIILGQTGRNFAAGMSGGIAYIWDEFGDFETKLNADLVDLDPLDTEDIKLLKTMIEKHQALTGSSVAKTFISNVDENLKRIIKVIPRDYKAVIEQHKIQINNKEEVEVVNE
ncbi:GltB/FmdC/FwdC-like GXGXG domain-containing protein, partial [Candidatus Enterovibrio escicola]